MTNDSVGKVIKAGLRSIAASVPVAASIAQAWNEYEAHVQSDRIAGFFADFKKEIAAVQVQIKAVEDHTINSGELPALMEGAVQSAKRQHDEEKRSRLARLLARLISSGSSITFDEKEDLINSLDTLSIGDLRVLSVFSDPGELAFEEIVHLAGGKDGTASDDQGTQVLRSLQKLESRGLIVEIVNHRHGVYLSGREFGTWKEKWLGKMFQLLPMGSALQNMALKDDI